MLDRVGQDPEYWDLESVVREAQRGNRRAFEVLCERYTDMVFRTAYAMLRDYDLAQEVTQDVFVKAYNKLNTCHPATFKAWLLKITTNECRNNLRGKRKAWWRSLLSYEQVYAAGPGRPADAPLPLDQVIHHEQQQEIWEALGDLSPELREVVVLHYFNNMQYEEIAQVLQCPIGTVKSRLHAARAKLHTVLRGAL